MPLPNCAEIEDAPGWMANQGHQQGGGGAEMPRSQRTKGAGRAQFPGCTRSVAALTGHGRGRGCRSMFAGLKLPLWGCVVVMENSRIANFPAGVLQGAAAAGHNQAASMTSS